MLLGESEDVPVERASKDHIRESRLEPARVYTAVVVQRVLYAEPLDTG